MKAETLLPIYLILLAIGGLAGLALALLGDRADLSPTAPFGPATFTAGLTCFGGTGILALRLFDLTPGRSLLAAALSAALSATLFFALARVARRIVERRQALADLVGALALVVTPIEPGRAGVITTDSGRPPLSLPAISPAGQTLPIGTVVVVTALRASPGGEAAEVAPLANAERHAPPNAWDKKVLGRVAGPPRA